VIDMASPTRIEPGLPKNELVAEILAEQVRGVDGHWGDYAAIVPLLPSGVDASAPHLTWDGRPFATGARPPSSNWRAATGAITRRFAERCSWARRRARSWTVPRRADRGARGRARGRAGGQPAGDVARALAAPLQRAGIERTRALRLSHRAELPARLGRAHDFVPPRRTRRCWNRA
jgi:ectoine hydrolase